MNLSAAAGTFDISGTSSGATITTLNGIANSHVTLGGQTLTISNGSTAYAGIIQGTGGLTVTGGTQILSGANTYTGTTTISVGTLQIGNAGATGSVTGDIVDNAALVFNRTGTLTYGGVISGTGSVTKSGTSTLTLTGNNTYAGGTTINAGTLAVSSDANLGAASVGLTFGGGTLRFDAGFTLNRDVTLNSSGGTFNTSGNAATLGGTISDIGGLTKSGAGTLTLTGTNTYQGNTTITAGALAVSTDANLGAATGTLTLRTGGALQFLANFTSDRNVTIGPGNAVFDTNGHDATLAGAISVGSSSTELHKIGAGTLTLTGNNTYIGQLQINAGTLILTGDNQPSITSTPINSGATLQIGNGGGTGSLTGNVTDDGLFIINRSNAYTFGGVISGAGSFVQTGAGTTTLTATNTYSGGTTISAGTLAVSADANLGNTSGGLSFGGGTLQYLAGFTSNRGVTLNAGGGTFDTNGNDATLGGTITGIGPLTKIGAGTLTLTGANIYSGGTTISGGTLQIGSGGPTGSIVGDIVNNAALTFNRSDDLAFSGAISGTGSLTKIGIGTLTLSGAGTYSGTTAVNAGTLQAGAANAFSAASAFTVASGATLDLASLNQTIGSLAGAGSVTLGSATLTTNGDNTSTTFSGVISGSGSLAKIGGGTLVLSGVNTYSGGTTLAAGTLRLENNQALGTGALTTTGSVVDYANGVTIANPIVVNSNTTQLQVTTGSATQAGVISELNGPRPLEKIGAGTLVLTAANTYSGATTITAGTLLVNGSIANSAVTVNSGAPLAGTGTVGATTINGGGTFAPGPLGTPGTMTVQGNLAFQSGALYLVQVNPSSASSANMIAGGCCNARGNRAGGVRIGKLRVAHLHHPHGRGRSRRHHVQRVDHDQSPRRLHPESELQQYRRDLEPHRRARGRGLERRQPAERRQHAQQFLQQWWHAAARLRERVRSHRLQSRQCFEPALRRGRDRRPAGRLSDEQSVPGAHARSLRRRPQRRGRRRRARARLCAGARAAAGRHRARLFGGAQGASDEGAQLRAALDRMGRRLWRQQSHERRSGGGRQP